MKVAIIGGGIGGIAATIALRVNRIEAAVSNPSFSHFFLCVDLTRSAADAPSSGPPYATSRTMRSFNCRIKCARVLRRVTSGAFG